MLEQMSYDLIFDRKIDKHVHSIAPDTYEIKVKGKTTQFDFMDYVGTIDERIPTILHVTQKNLDVESFPEAKKINVTDLMVAVFTEFHIDVYAENESDIIVPQAVKNLVFDFSAGIRVYANPDLQSSADFVLSKWND